MKDVAPRYDQFRNALAQLTSAISRNIGDDTLLRDGIIQRFEFTFDSAWKTMRHHMTSSFGVNADLLQSPKPIIREAYRQGIIGYETDWITMVDDRNNTSHTYSEELAQQIYSHIPRYIDLFTELSTKLP